MKIAILLKNDFFFTQKHPKTRQNQQKTPRKRRFCYELASADLRKTAPASESFYIGCEQGSPNEVDGTDRLGSEAAKEFQFLLPALANVIAATMELRRIPQHHVARVNRWGKEI